jgi:hypothetical protein
MTILGDKGGCHFDVWGSDFVLATEQDGMLVDVKPQLTAAANANDAWPSAWRKQHDLFAIAVKSRSPIAWRSGRVVPTKPGCGQSAASAMRVVSPSGRKAIEPLPLKPRSMAKSMDCAAVAAFNAIFDELAT